MGLQGVCSDSGKLSGGRATLSRVKKQKREDPKYQGSAKNVDNLEKANGNNR